MPDHYLLRYMGNADVPRVFEIDQRSFPLPWTPSSYAYELNENAASHMVVLEKFNFVAVRGFWGRFRRNGRQSTIIAYGGMWLIAGEAHISTIAVHPDHRRSGLGECLFNAMIRRGLALGAEYCVLEVRVSNITAQNLYEKYGFQATRRRKAYYRDNGDDALEMYAGPFDGQYMNRMQMLATTLQERLVVSDQLANTDPWKR